MRIPENGLLDLEGSGGRVVVDAVAATAPKIPPHPAISRRTSCLRMYPRAAGIAQTPPIPTPTGTSGATNKNQKAMASWVSSGPGTNLETIQPPTLAPTRLSTRKDDHLHPHPTATEQSILLGRCRVLPSPTKTCQAKGRRLPRQKAEGMVVLVPMLPAKDNNLLLREHPRPKARYPIALTTPRLV